MSATTLTAAEQESRRKRRQTRRALLAPALLIILSISILPLGITAVYSFLTPGTYGGVIWDFTPNAYIQFLFERGCMSFFTKSDLSGICRLRSHYDAKQSSFTRAIFTDESYSFVG